MVTRLMNLLHRRTVIAIALMAFLVTQPALWAQQSWRVEVIDRGNGRKVGKFTSLAIDRDDNLHVGYYDETRQALRYGFRDASAGRWYTMEVDASGGYESLAVDKNGNPHFAYAGPNESGLRYAEFDGKKWTKQTLDYERIDFFNFIRIGPDNKPRISYYQRLQRDGSFALHLKYASWDGKAWYTETVDPRSATGKFNSLALDQQGQPHISYSDVDSGDLLYASSNGSEWHFNAADTHQQAEGWVGIGSSIEIDSSNTPHIAYVDSGHRHIKYATWQQKGGWKTEVVDTISGKTDNIDRVSLKFDHLQRPHIAYWDSGMGVLRYATLTSKGWRAETVDSGDNVGLYPSLAIDSRDGVYISYYDMANGALRLAYRRATPEVQQQTTRNDTAVPQE